MLLIAGFVSRSHSQVSISPTSLFFDANNRFSSLIVSNGSEQAQEVSIEIEFGYTASDKNGNLHIANDPDLAKRKSISDWLRAFPRSFTLQSGQRQTVRFVVRPPQNLSTGGYWSRVKIISNPLSPPIESTDNAVTAQINLVVEQVISAHYRTNGAETGLSIENIQFYREGGMGEVRVSMQQTGNAPFIGSLALELIDTDDTVVDSRSSTMTVYTRLTRSMTFDLEGLAPGNYTVRATARSQRNDVSPENLLPIKPVTLTKEISID
ncbi:MAG: hypothetical protein R3224_08280 [Balneolaceae bacterium]|nr:hypothetical protein [Balneolaceae bacterium]